MARTNPVLYNIGLNTPGKSTGVFRRVSAAQPLSNVASQRAQQLTTLNQSLAAAEQNVAKYSGAYEDVLATKDTRAGTAQSGYQTILDSIKAQKPALDEQARAVQVNINSMQSQLNWFDTQLKAVNDGYLKPSKQSEKWFFDAAVLRQRIAELKAQQTALYEPLKQQQAAGYDTYKSSIDALNAELKAAYDQAYGATNEAKATYESGTRDLDAIGYLASGFDSTLVPDVSTSGSSLAATELYSDELDTRMIGKKNTALTSGAPAEDIVTGTMQSGLWR